MELLTFALVLDPADDRAAGVAPCDPAQITPFMWERLAGDLATESSLLPATAALLERRCREGYAAVAVHDGCIVSHIALAPVVYDGSGAPSWERLAAGLGEPGVPLPSAGVFSFTNSWTAPEWRRRRISLSIRRRLIDRYLRPGHLGISDMYGLASPLAGRLGWRIIAWDRAPFLGSLVSVPAEEFPGQAVNIWHAPPGTRLYQGPPIGLDAPGRSWEGYVYLWVSDIELVDALEAQVRACFCGDLHRWRSAVVSTFADPELIWKVPFDSYQPI